MAELRIRIELQRSSKGVEMPKLSELAEESQKLLRAVAEDVGINDPAGVWVAEDFYNQGVGFNGVYKFADVDPEQAGEYIHAFEALDRVSKDTEWRANGSAPATVVQYAKLARVAKDGEAVRIGFPDDQNVVSDWRRLDKPKAEAIIQHYEAIVQYSSMLQGRIHSIYKEANPPYFTLREFASGELVRCEFRASDWPFLHKALERKDGIVTVSGWIHAKRLDRSISLVKVERIKGTSPVRSSQLQAFFGSAPDWTGGMTTDQYLDANRQDDGEE